MWKALTEVLVLRHGTREVVWMFVDGSKTEAENLHQPSRHLQTAMAEEPERETTDKASVVPLSNVN